METKSRLFPCQFSQFILYFQGMEGGLEQERLQQETELHQRVNEEEV